MSDEDEVVALLTVARSGIQYINRRERTLGRYNAAGELEDMIGADLPEGYVWVHDPQADRRSSSAAKNLSTEKAAGVDVIVFYNVATREDEVWGVNPLTTPERFGGDVAAALNSARKTVNMPTPVTATDIVTGGLYASTMGGLNVIITAFEHINGYWTGETEKLLTPTAAAGKKALNCIGIDVYANAYVEVRTQDRSIVYSSMFPEDAYALIKEYPTVWWAGAVELANGDTTINPSRAVDLRLWRVPTALAQTSALIQMYRHFH